MASIVAGPPTNVDDDRINKLVRKRNYWLGVDQSNDGKTAETMDCPRCFRPNVTMKLVTLKEGHGCVGCRGIWLSSEKIHWMTDGSLGQFGDLSPGDDNTLPRCPVCERKLKPCHLTDVEIDVCDLHGIWFDPDELERLVEIHRIRNGRAAATAFTGGLSVLCATSIYGPKTSPEARSTDDETAEVIMEVLDGGEGLAECVQGSGDVLELLAGMLDALAALGDS